MARQIKRASLNEEEAREYSRLSKRLGISNESDLIKKAVRLANYYCDYIESIVPQDVFQAYLDKLHYSKEVGKRPINRGHMWKAPDDKD